MSKTQVREHAGHSHSHGHHDNSYLTSMNKDDAGVKITRIGLFVNLGMAIGKGVGGYVFHSQALIADGFHALTDLFSDFMTLATISWSLKPPTDRFPAGYGKIESLGALGVSGLLLFGGIGMGLNGLDTLYTQFFADVAQHAGEHAHSLLPSLGHSHSHSHSHSIPDLNAAWLAAGSIVVKEWLYRATIKVARERKSSVLASNAVHHRVDSLTSIVALLTIGGAHVIADASWLDPVGGLIIAGMVIRAGWGNTMTSLLELADVTIDTDIKEKVRRSANKTLKGDLSKGLPEAENGLEVEIRDIQGIKSGQNYLIDLELAVPRSFTLKQTTVIEEAVRARIGSKVRGVRRVRVKFVATEEHDKTLAGDFITSSISPRSSPEPEDEHEHSDHVHSNGHLNNSHDHKKNR